MKRLSHMHQGHILTLIGFISTCAFALTKIHTPEELSNVLALPMVLLGFFSIYYYGNNITIKPVMLLLASSILIPLASWIWVYQNYPQWTDPSPHLDKIARVFLFVPIAWWLKDSPKKVFLFWGIAALSVLVSPWIGGGGGWKEILRGWHGGRIDFDLRNAGHTSLLFGFILIGLLCFTSRLYHWKKLSLIILVPCTLFCIFTMIAAQTRAAWLALIVSAAISFCYFLALKKYRRKISLKSLLFTLISCLLVAIIAYNTMGKIVAKRSTAESSTIEHILSGDFDHIPYTSVGIRIHLWRAALTKIEQRPLLGWGNRGQAIAIDHNDWMPNYIKLDFGHLHNVYLSILTNYGVIGLVFYFIWFGWILKEVIKAVSKGYLNKDVGYFTLAVFGFWSVVNLFESYLFFWTGVFCIQVFFGGLLALVWHAQILENKQKETHQDT